MDNLQNLVWQKPTMVVALLNLILSVLDFVLLVLFVFGVELGSPFRQFGWQLDYVTPEFSLTDLPFVVCISQIVYLCAVLLEIFAAKCLFKATKQNADVTGVVRNGILWCRITLSCILPVTIFHILNGLSLFWFLRNFFRVGGCYVVFQYSKELLEVLQAILNAVGAVTPAPAG